MVRPTGTKNTFNHRAGGSRKGAGRKPAPTQKNALATYFGGTGDEHKSEENLVNITNTSSGSSESRKTGQERNDTSEIERISKIRSEKREKCVKKLEKMEESIWEELSVHELDEDENEDLSIDSSLCEGLDNDYDDNIVF